MKVISEAANNLGLPTSDSEVTADVQFRIGAVTSFFVQHSEEDGESYIMVDMTGGPSYPLIYTDELYAELCKEFGYD